MMIKPRETELPGCFELQSKVFQDERGLFIKTFHSEMFTEIGLQTEWAEEFYSISHKGVLRGLHFQIPPHDHDKLVYCVSGEILDVVVDLRIGSPSYGKTCIFELRADIANMVYIPRGMAHGFYTLSDSAAMVYKVSTVHAPSNDAGILWNSVDVPWPNTNPTISQRDRSFPTLSDFVSPFIYKKENR
jgi:dTDP-4-dehydrorhamnose 3,5-epimerase